jgi:hypothetical protein
MSRQTNRPDHYGATSTLGDRERVVYRAVLALNGEGGLGADYRKRIVMMTGRGKYHVDKYLTRLRDCGVISLPGIDRSRDEPDPPADVQAQHRDEAATIRREVLLPLFASPPQVDASDWWAEERAFRDWYLAGCDADEADEDIDPAWLARRQRRRVACRQWHQRARGGVA